MATFDNLNYSTSHGVAPGIVEYHEKGLLANAVPDMVYARDAQKRNLPEGNGKHVNFRRMTPFGPVIEPLKEGVTPAGQELKQTAFSVMVKPYGAHVEMTDELDLYHIDNLHRETNKLLSDQAALSLDTIVRNAVCAGMNVQYAGGKATRGAITAADKLTADEIKKAVRTLRRNNCKPFADGFYHAIVHPDAVYDLTSDPLWVDVAKYQDKEKIDRYELGNMYKVKFFESTNAKVFDGDTYLYGTTANLTVSGGNADTRMVSYSAVLTEDDARALTGKLVDGSDGTNTFPLCVERVDTTNKKIVFRWLTADSAKITKIQPAGAGASGASVYGTVIYGEDAFGAVALGGNGGNVRVIINPPGSSGAADPLEQRGTIAWKVKGFAAAILQDAFIVRLEHGATA